MEEKRKEHLKAWELARSLVAIDSSDPGAYEETIGLWICRWLKERAGQAGLTVAQKEGEEGQVLICRREVLPGRYNVLARIQGRDSGLPALNYICHMDTVTLGDGWDPGIDPLGAMVKDGRMYGRGSCDMKSGLACALTAFGAVMDHMGRTGMGPLRSMAFIGTVDEEDFMRGAEAAIEWGWVKAEDWCLDTEPTDGRIQGAHKGRTWFELTIQGVTAHASTPWKGADAIAAMAEAVCLIRRRISECPVHSQMGPSTVTFGQIEGGYRPYVVPDSCRVWIDMRLVPPMDTAGAVRIVQEAIARAEEKVKGVSGSFVITGDRPWVECHPQAPLVQALSRACVQAGEKEPEITVFNGYTDTAVIAGKLGCINALSYGPGSLEMAHKPNEYVPLEEVERCEKVLTTLALQNLYGKL